MEIREDPLDSVIEEIAALLATAYLRLWKARTLSQAAAAPTPGLQATGEPLDSAPGDRSQSAATLAPHEKGV
jgi:hypothetical protein